MNWIHFLDFLGTFVFAISGALAAMGKRMDWFGASIIAFVTAVGGGTLRDVLMGNTPVFWIKSIEPLYCIMLAILVAVLFRKQIMKWRRTMFLFDTIGIGVFTIIGLEKALDFNLNPASAIIMGLSTAVVGGIIRDILCNDIPLIFEKEIYATPCLVGALIFLVLDGFQVPELITQCTTIIIIIALRLTAIRFQWSFPRFSIDEDS